MNRTKSAIIPLLFLLAALIAVPGREATGRERVRIGLALQGGGAKGFAHIGVLQWFEENRIPVDLIAGTSMGGLIGGIYAIGQSPVELGSLVDSLNWDELIGGQTSFRLLDFRRKEDRLQYPNHLEFGLRGGFWLPSGLNSGQRIGLLLDDLTLPYYGLKSFDDLPVPFRCVAVDLVSGQEVVFSSGSLRDALRATMSLPAVFTPLHRDGRVYADGGLLNNLPVDVVKKMGDAKIVAVHLDVGDYDPKNLGSLVGVLGRSMDAMMHSTVVKNLEIANLVIRVNVRDFSTLDFKSGSAIIQKGYEAAAAQGSELLQYALPQDEWKQYLDDRESRKKTEIPIPQFVTLESGIASAPAWAIAKDLSEFPGHPLNIHRLERKLNVIWGQERYSAIGYSVTERNTRPGLLIRPETKEHSPPMLNLNLNIDGSDVENIRFGMGARFTMLDLGGYRSEWRSDVAFGSQNLVSTEYHYALAASPHWFVEPRAYAENSILDIYYNGDRISEYRVGRGGFGIDGGYRLNRYMEIRLGQDFTWYTTKLRVGLDPVGSYSQFASVSGLQIRYFGQDDAVVPRSGARIEAKARWFSSRPYGGSGYPSSEARVSWYQPVSRNGSVFFSGSGGTAFGRENLGLLLFSLGGIFKLGSYGKNELLGNQYYLLTGGYIHQIGSLPSLVGDEIYAGGWYQLGKMYGNTGLPEHPMDGSGGLIIKTMIGPIFLGGSWGDSGHHKLYFGLGQIF